MKTNLTFAEVKRPCLTCAIHKINSWWVSRYYILRVRIRGNRPPEVGCCKFLYSFAVVIDSYSSASRSHYRWFIIGNDDYDERPSIWSSLVLRQRNEERWMIWARHRQRRRDFVSDDEKAKEASAINLPIKFPHPLSSFNRLGSERV